MRSVSSAAHLMLIVTHVLKKINAPVARMPPILLRRISVLHVLRLTSIVISVRKETNAQTALTSQLLLKKANALSVICSIKTADCA